MMMVDQTSDNTSPRPDLQAASGDATLRLIAAGTVAPVNVELIPNYDQIFEGLKLQPGALREYA